jgi:hypothetical protein
VIRLVGRLSASSAIRRGGKTLGGRSCNASSSPSRRLLVVGSVRRIIGGLNFREPLHADGVDLSDPMLERSALDLILYLAIPQNAFQGDELPFLQGLGELREIPPGIDAMPFGAILVVALVVLQLPSSRSSS